MPPRGHHEYQLPASKTDKHGHRKVQPSRGGSGGVGSWGGGLGIDPRSIDNYYGVGPDGKPTKHQGQFADTWQQNREGVYNAAIAQQRALEQARQQKIALLTAQADARSQQMAQHFKDLQALAKGIANNRTSRIAAKYGLEQFDSTGKRVLTAAQQKEYAQTLAMRFSQGLDQSTKSPEGKAAFQDWANQLDQSVKDRRHLDFIRAQKDIAAEIKSTPEQGSILTDAIHTIARDKGYTDAGHNLWRIGQRLEGGLATEAHLAAPIFQPLKNSWNALDYAWHKTGNPLTALHAGLAGLPGLGFTAGGGSAARNAVEATNTESEQSLARAQGWTLTVGEEIAQDKSRLNNRALANAFGVDPGTVSQTGEHGLNSYLSFTVPKDIPLVGGTKINAVSGLFDAIFAVGQDPTIPLGKVGHVMGDLGWATRADIAAGNLTTKPLQDGSGLVYGFAEPEVANGIKTLSGRVNYLVKTAVDRAPNSDLSEEATSWLMHTTRASIIEQSPVGRATAAAMADSIYKTGGNTRTITRLLNESMEGKVSKALVERVVAAGNDIAGTDSYQAISEVLKDAFARGQWNPHVSLADQASKLLASSGGDSFRAHVGSWLGEHTIGNGKYSGALDTLRTRFDNFVWDKTTAPRGLFELGTAGEGVFALVHWAAGNDRQWLGDVLKALDRSAGDVQDHFSMADRLVSLARDAEAINNPTFRQYIDEISIPLRRAKWEELSPAAQDTLAEQVRWAEAASDILQGAVLPRGKATAEDVLNRLVQPYDLETGHAGYDAVKASGQAGIGYTRRYTPRPVDVNPATIDERMVGPNGLIRNRSGEVQNFKITYKNYSDPSVWAVAEQVAVDDLVDYPTLQERLLKDLRGSEFGSQEQAKAASAIDIAVSDRHIAEEAEARLLLNKDRENVFDLAQTLFGADQPSLFARFHQGGSSILRSISEKVPVNTIALNAADTEAERAQMVSDALTRYSDALYSDAARRRLWAEENERVAWEVARGASPERIKELHTAIYRGYMLEKGLPSEVIDAFIEGETKAAASRVAARATGHGVELSDDGYKLVQDVSLITQRETTISFPKHEQLDNIAEDFRKLVVDNMDASMATRIRVFYDEHIKGFVLTVRNKGTQAEKSITLGSIAHGFGTLFKAMVTTKVVNGMLIGIGTYAATGDPLTAVIAGLTGTALLRYRARIDLQNRFAALTEHGMTPEEWAPGWMTFWKRGQRAEYGAGTSTLLPDTETAPWFSRRLGIVKRDVLDQWEVMALKPGKLSDDELDALDRVFNYQLSPETDPVAELLLRKKAGQMSAEQMDQELRYFLSTEDGAAWQSRMTLDGKYSVDTAIENSQVWIDQYVNKTLAQERLASMEARLAGGDGTLTRDALQSLHDSGDLPFHIHAQQTKGILRSGLKGISETFGTAIRNAAYDTGRNKRFRETFYYAERQRVENLYVSAGMARKEAQEIASEVATRTTNRLMFRYDNISRAAHTVDWLFPFTGHRWFNAATWTRQVFNNPGRILRLGVHAAQAFNNGVGAGIFYKDPYGQWMVRIPGAGVVSDILGVSGINFDLPLTGFYALTSEAGHADSPLGAVTSAIAPHPGGPWMIAAGAAVKEFNPEWGTENGPGGKWASEFLFPYGPQGGLLDSRSLVYLRAMGAVGGVWDFIDDGQAEEQLKRLEILNARDMMADHQREHPQDVMWTPTKEAVQDRVRAMLLAQNAIAMFSPSYPHPEFQNEAKFNELWKAFVVTSGLNPDKLSAQDFGRLRNEFLSNPRTAAYGIFLDSTGKWDNSSWDTWVKSGGELTPEEYNLEKVLGHRSYRGLKDYLDTFKQNREDSAYYKDWRHADANPNPLEREKALQSVERDHPEAAGRFHTRSMAERDLARILTYPPSQQKDAIDRWRHRWARVSGPHEGTVSRGDFLSIKSSIDRNKRKHQGNYFTSPWATSRNGEELWKDLGLKYPSATGPDGVTLNPHLMAVEATLSNPVEQYRMWQEVLIQLDNNWTMAQQDPERFGQVRSAVTKHLHDIKVANWQVWNTDPPSTDQLSLNYALEKRRADQLAIDPNSPSSYTKAMEAGSAIGQFQWRMTTEKENLRFQIDQVYKNINDLTTQMDGYRAGKQWAAYYSMKDKRTALYDQITQLRNEAFAKAHDPAREKEMHDAIRESVFSGDYSKLTPDARRNALRQIQNMNEHSRWMISTDEESHYMNLSPAAKQAYVATLQHGLSLPGDLMKELYGAADVEALLGRGKRKDLTGKLYWNWLSDFQKSLLDKNMDPGQVEAWKGQNEAADKARSKSSGHGGHHGGSDEVSWAYAMMRQYSKRGGMKKPAGYDAYLAIGNNPAQKAQYLQEHPDVAEYVKAGPMANMPPVIQMMVANIMIGAGKWDGETMDIHQLTDIAFAREQLQRYNKRTGPAPATYDLWLNMPSGQAKADYLNQHQEIKNWIAQGPMANMPEAYRDVVRDIMYRYHEWTAGTDGMGDTIAGYYRTPSYARQQYLQQHPELAAYWAASRSPADAAMGALVDQYYSTPDPGAKSGMLAAHPELKQYLLDSRTRRYERFLNQVAQFMGANPDLFQSYLDNQNRVMEQLLTKFAIPNLANEEHWLKPVKPQTKSTEGGRRRG